MWKCQGMPRALDRIWETWEVNSGQLSDWRDWDTKSRDDLSEEKIRDWALLLVVENASTHPEKMSTKTRRYLTHLIVCMWVKSSYQSVPGREPLAWWIGKGRPQYLELELDVWQIVQAAVIDLRKCRSSGVVCRWFLTKEVNAWLLGWMSWWRYDRVWQMSKVEM